MPSSLSRSPPPIMAMASPLARNNNNQHQHQHQHQDAFEVVWPNFGAVAPMARSAVSPMARSTASPRRSTASVLPSPPPPSSLPLQQQQSLHHGAGASPSRPQRQEQEMMASAFDQPQTRRIVLSAASSHSQPPASRPGRSPMPQRQEIMVSSSPPQREMMMTGSDVVGDSPGFAFFPGTHPSPISLLASSPPPLPLPDSREKIPLQDQQQQQQQRLPESIGPTNDNADVLRPLNHPTIPRGRDFGHLDTSVDSEFTPIRARLLDTCESLPIISSSSSTTNLPPSVPRARFDSADNNNMSSTSMMMSMLSKASLNRILNNNHTNKEEQPILVPRDRLDTETSHASLPQSSVPHSHNLNTELSSSSSSQSQPIHVSVGARSNTDTSPASLAQTMLHSQLSTESSSSSQSPNPISGNAGRGRGRLDSDVSHASLPQSKSQSMVRSRLSTESSSASQTIPISVRGRLDTTDSAVTVPHYNRMNSIPGHALEPPPRRELEKNNNQTSSSYQQPRQVSESSHMTSWKINNHHYAGRGLDNRAHNTSSSSSSQRNNGRHERAHNMTEYEDLSNSVGREFNDNDVPTPKHTNRSPAFSNNDVIEGGKLLGRLVRAPSPPFGVDNNNNTGKTPGMKEAWLSMNDDYDNDNDKNHMPSLNREFICPETALIKNELGVMDNATDATDDDDDASLMFGGDNSKTTTPGINESWLMMDDEEDDNNNNNEEMELESPGAALIMNELGVMDNGTFSDDDASSIIFTYTDSHSKNGQRNNNNNNGSSNNNNNHGRDDDNINAETDLFDENSIPEESAVNFAKSSEHSLHDNVQKAAAAAATTTTKKKNVIDRLPANLDRRTEEEDDAGSDVSSLSDTVNYQQINAVKKKSKNKLITSPSSGKGSNVSGNYKPASSMAVMAALLKPKGLRRLQRNPHKRQSVHDIKEDTITTAATSVGKSTATAGHSLDNRTSHTLDTIGHQSLENRMLTKEMQKHDSQRGLGRIGLFDNTSILIPSPLDAELDREKTRRFSSGTAPTTTAHSRRSSLSQVHTPSSHRRSRTSVGWATAGSCEKNNGGAHHHHHVRTPSGGSGGRGHRYSTSLGSEHGGGAGIHQGSWFRNSREDNSPGSSIGIGIQGSWLVPSPGAQHYHSLPLNYHQTGKHVIETPGAGEDLIDVSKDEPVDPFSGLIGMPTMIGCESVASGDALGDGGSYAGLNVFSSHSPSEIASLGKGNQIMMPVSSRPPAGRRVKCSTFDSFDPLIEEGLMDSHSLHSHSCSMSTLSRHPLSAAPLPPRHHRDDPLLSNSRYRSPLQQAATPQKYQPKSTKKNKANLGHRKSSSLGVIGHGGLGNMANTCMFGSIANMETTKTPMTPLGMARDTSCTSLEWDGSLGPTSVGGISLGQSLGRTSATLDTLTPGSLAGEQQVFTTPNGTPVDGNNKPEDDDGDDSSYGSFSEEFKRPDGKRKIVKNEFKHKFGWVLPIGKPVVKASRKLLGMEKEGKPGLKRAEGCLT